MNAIAPGHSAKRHDIRTGAPSPIVLTKSELRNACALIERIAHSNLPARDAMLVAELSVRFARSA